MSRHLDQVLAKARAATAEECPTYSMEAIELENSQHLHSLDMAALESQLMLADLDDLNATVASIEGLHQSLMLLPETPENLPAIRQLTHTLDRQLARYGVQDGLGLERIDIDGTGFIQKAGHATVAVVKKIIAFIGHIIAKIAAFIKNIFVGLSADLNRAQAAVRGAKGVLKMAPAGGSYAVPMSARTKGALGPHASNLSKYLSDNLVNSADFKAVHSFIHGALEHSFQLTEANETSTIGSVISHLVALNLSGFAHSHQGGVTVWRPKAHIEGVRQIELTMHDAGAGQGTWPGLERLRAMVGTMAITPFKEANQSPSHEAEAVAMSTAEISTALGSMDTFLTHCLTWVRDYKSVFGEIEDLQSDTNKKFEAEAHRIEAALGSADQAAAQEAARANAENHQRLIYAQQLAQVSLRFSKFFEEHGQAISVLAGICRGFARSTTSIIKQTAGVAKAEAKQVAKGY